MADISSITLPNGNTYDLKDTKARSGIQQTKTFTGIIGATLATAYFYYGVIKPTNYYAQWSIKYRLDIVADGSDICRAVHEVVFTGTQSTLTAYHVWNSIASTSYLPTYSHELYRATEVGITNNYGHALGSRLQSSWNPTNTNNKRTVKVDIIETINCVFSFFDEALPYADIPGSGATNYAGVSEINSRTQGLQETSDDNTVHTLTAHYYYLEAGANKIFPYTIIMHKPDGTWESIVTSSSVNTKTVNTSGFLIDSLFYTTSTKAAGEKTGAGTVYITTYAADSRYILNGVTTSASTTGVDPGPLYLVGRIINGLLYLDETQWWSQELPTSDDGKVYIFIGYIFNAYQYTFNKNHEVYWYKNGVLRQMGADSLTVTGHTVATDVPANAKFTDTTYPLSIVHSTDSDGDVFDITFTTT